MKNFVNLIKQIHRENHFTVKKTIIEKKIPVAFLSIATNMKLDKSIDFVKNLREQGLNVTTFVVTVRILTPPPRQP